MTARVLVAGSRDWAIIREWSETLFFCNVDTGDFESCEKGDF